MNEHGFPTHYFYNALILIEDLDTIIALVNYAIIA